MLRVQDLQSGQSYAQAELWSGRVMLRVQVTATVTDIVDLA